ncbi:MAG: hypothetical protein QNK24_12415 [Desulfuromusa sp.]|nr:hypothetical protein [Desulfuromusa sp.]
MATAALAAVPIAVFPLQDLSEGRNDVNLSLTRVLESYLEQNDNNIIGVDTVITFMANNRIRTVGQLESFNAFRVRDELRAGFVLLGTVIQRKERPDPTFALYLSLIRTNDARTIWSYSGSVSTAEERNMLGVNEPLSSDKLQSLLLDEMFERWPWQRINEVQELEAVNIDSIRLEPKNVRPGEEINCHVKIRESWGAHWAPRVFFKVDEQIYPATVSDDGKNFEGTWVAGEQSSRPPVYLLLEWAQYNRTETVLLGSYVIDDLPPFLELDLRGGVVYEGKPVFNRQVAIVPKMIVRQTLARWRLHINFILHEGGDTAFVGEMKGQGNFPGSFIWKGNKFYGDGTYEFVIEAWDRAGNFARVSKVAEFIKELPTVALALAKSEDEMVMDVDYAGKVPLRYWRLEMWSKEGRLLTKAEGSELPVKVGFTPPDAGPNQEISGFVFLQDALGKQAKIKVEDFLPELNKVPDKKEAEATGVSESWVDEF